MLESLDSDRRAMLAQLVRFGTTGVLVTALGVAVYVLVVRLVEWHPQIGNVLAYLTAMATGYVMHSKWSFRDQGGERTHGTKAKFVLVSLISYALNAFWVWLLFTYLDLGDLAPVVPMLLVTPLVTFFLNRQWVFR